MIEEFEAKIGHLPEIKIINFDTNDESYHGILQKLKNQSKDSHVLNKIGMLTFESTLNSWKKKTSTNWILRNQLPNIIYLNEDGWRASIQLRTMEAMLNQS